MQFLDFISCCVEFTLEFLDRGTINFVLRIDRAVANIGRVAARGIVSDEEVGAQVRREHRDSRGIEEIARTPTG